MKTILAATALAAIAMATGMWRLLILAMFWGCIIIPSIVIWDLFVTWGWRDKPKRGVGVRK